MATTKKRIRKVAQNGVLIGGIVVDDLNITTNQDKNAPSVDAVNNAITNLSGIGDMLDQILGV